MKCQKCGKSNTVRSVYCQECGAKLENPKPIKNKHNTAILLGWIGVVLFMPLGFVTGLYLATQKDKEAKKQGWIMIGVSVIWAYIIFIIIPYF